MRIAVIGASGTIGSRVADALQARHAVVRASRRGPAVVDLEAFETITAFFANESDFDAVVSCAASVPLAPFESYQAGAFERSLKAKLFGQVELVRVALPHLRNGGSITLTGGTFVEPLAGSAAGALANAGLEGFVRGAALDMPRGIRLNVVSPGWVSETLLHLGMDPTAGTPAETVAAAYVEAVEGTAHGRTLSPAAG